MSRKDPLFRGSVALHVMVALVFLATIAYIIFEIDYHCNPTPAHSHSPPPQAGEPCPSPPPPPAPPVPHSPTAS